MESTWCTTGLEFLLGMLQDTWKHAETFLRSLWLWSVSKVLPKSKVGNV